MRQSNLLLYLESMLNRWRRNAGIVAFCLTVGGGGGWGDFGRALMNNIITIRMVKMRVNKSYNQLIFSWCRIKMF